VSECGCCFGVLVPRYYILDLVVSSRWFHTRVKSPPPTPLVMAAFVAKQMVGSKLSAVKGLGGDQEGGGDKDADDAAEQERLEVLREAEERRKEKHRKMEEEREKMRQGIRDKYGIKKREEKEAEQNQQFESSSLNRKKKTPEELAKEAEAEDEDEFTKLKNTLESQVNEIKSQIEGKCVLQ